MKSKLLQTKDETNQTKIAIEQAFRDRTKPFVKGIGSASSTVARVGAKITKIGIKIASAFTFKPITKTVSTICSMFGSLKNKLVNLVSGVAILSILNGGFQKFKNTVSSVLKTDDKFNTSLNQIRGNLMVAFAPIYNAILPALNTLMSALTKITATIAQFTSSLFGTSLTNATKQAKKLSSALEDTRKSGEAASGSLASFDKLEVIGADSSNSNSGVGAEYDYSAVTEANSKLLELLNRIKILVSDGDWGGLANLISDSFVNGLNNIQNKIKGINWSGIGKSVSKFITNIDYSGILVGLVSVFSEAVLGLQNLLLSIDWETFTRNLSTGIKDAIFKISDYIKQIKWSKIGQTISTILTSIDWAGLGNSIITLIWNGITGIGELLLNIDWNEIGKTLSDTISSWINTVIDLIQSTDWVKLGSDIIAAVFDFIDGIDWLELVGNILLGLADGIIAFSGLVVGAIKELIKRILEFLGIHSPSTLFADVGKNLMLGLINGIKSLINTTLSVFKGLWNNIISGAKNAWSSIKKVFSSVATFFGNIFSTAWTKVKNVFSTGGKIFSGIKDGIENAFKSIVNTLIRGINKIVSIPFNGINKSLEKIKNVNILGKKPFAGLIHTVDIPKLPELATGTVIPPRQKFAAILGDQRHGVNIEAPLETIKQANEEVFDEKIARLEQFLSNANTSNRDIIIERLDVHLECDKRELGKVSYKGLKLVGKEMGKQLFVEG